MQRAMFALGAFLCPAAQFSALAQADRATQVSNSPYPYHEVSTTWARLRTALDGIAGWPVAVPLQRFDQDTLLEAVDRAHVLRLAVIEASSAQQVSPDIRKPLDARLSPHERQAVAAAVKAAGLQLRVYAVPSIPSDEADARAQFEFAGAIGASVVAVDRLPAALPRLDDLTAEYGIHVAVRGIPSALAIALRGRSQRIGVYADVGEWLDNGIRPLDALDDVIHRLMVIRLVDRDAGGRLGTGSTGIPELLDALQRAPPPRSWSTARAGQTFRLLWHARCPISNRRCARRPPDAWRNSRGASRSKAPSDCGPLNGSR